MFGCKWLKQVRHLWLLFLLNPKFLKWLEKKLEKLCHQSEAGSLVEEIKFLVVFISLSWKVILWIGLFRILAYSWHRFNFNWRRKNNIFSSFLRLFYFFLMMNLFRILFGMLFLGFYFVLIWYFFSHISVFVNSLWSSHNFARNGWLLVAPNRNWIFRLYYIRDHSFSVVFMGAKWLVPWTFTLLHLVSQLISSIVNCIPYFLLKYWIWYCLGSSIILMLVTSSLRKLIFWSLLSQSHNWILNLERIFKGIWELSCIICE